MDSVQLNVRESEIKGVCVGVCVPVCFTALIFSNLKDATCNICVNLRVHSVPHVQTFMQIKCYGVAILWRRRKEERGGRRLSIPRSLQETAERAIVNV